MASILADAFLLLGAGASADANVPTAYQFVARIRAYLAKLPSEASGSLLAEFDNVVNTIRKATGSEPGLEPFFEAIDDCLDAHYNSADPPNALRASRAIERIHYETKRVIQQECDVRDEARVAYLQPLLTRLREFGPVPVVSFNYDSVVETACSKLGLTYAESVLNENVAQCDIELVKVHGSVTWLPDNKSGGLQRNRKFESAIMRQFGELRSPTLETPMIYPSRRKMPIHEPFMRNALRLQRLLHTKKNCISVGYSFPDFHVRSWLADALKDKPELSLYLVGPSPESQTFDNLTKNLPTVAWTKRLRLVRKRFGEAIAEGFETCLAKAELFSPDVFYPADRATLHCAQKPCSTISASGIGASPDGEAIYVSEGSPDGRLFRIDLETGQQTEFAAKLKNPRGVAVRADGSVLVVQNRLFRSRAIPSAGAGTVVEISPDGRSRRLLTRLRYCELLRLALELRKGTPWSDLRDRLRAVLSWPTDVTCNKDGAVFVTEARALVQIDKTDTMPRRICKPDLAFNLHGIDIASDGALVGVEQGVGQAFSWGRVLRFELTPDGVLYAISSAAKGRSRLMAICYVPPLNKVIVTQTLTWPHGGLLVLDYPALDNPKFLAGFDFPQKVEYVPKRDLLAVSTLYGVELIPLTELDRGVAC